MSSDCLSRFISRYFIIFYETVNAIISLISFSDVSLLAYRNSPPPTHTELNKSLKIVNNIFHLFGFKLYTLSPLLL